MNTKNDLKINKGIAEDISIKQLDLQSSYMLTNIIFLKFYSGGIVIFLFQTGGLQ